AAGRCSDSSATRQYTELRTACSRSPCRLRSAQGRKPQWGDLDRGAATHLLPELSNRLGMATCPPRARECTSPRDTAGAAKSHGASCDHVLRCPWLHWWPPQQ